MTTIAPHLGVKNEVEGNEMEGKWKGVYCLYTSVYMCDDYKHAKTRKEIPQFSSISSDLGHIRF